MLKLNLALPKADEIEINGDIFEICPVDGAILTKSAELMEKYSEVKEWDTSPEYMRLLAGLGDEIVSLIDSILGEGATAKISKGRPVKFVVLAEWFQAICGEVAKVQNTKSEAYISETYE